MTPSDVLTSVRSQLYEPVATFWTDDELRNYMWQAEQEIATTFKCVRVNTTITSVTAQSMYTRPVDAYYIDRLTWDKVKLKKIDMTDYDALQRVAYGGMYTIGRPMHYVEYNQDSLMLWPIPQYDAPINIQYEKIPSQIVSGTTAFDIPPMFHNMIQDYVLYRALLKDQDDQRAGFFKTAWEKDMQDAWSVWARFKNADRYHVVKEEDTYRTLELGII
jgi:hypothetical protein